MCRYILTSLDLVTRSIREGDVKRTRSEVHSPYTSRRSEGGANERERRWDNERVWRRKGRERREKGRRRRAEEGGGWRVEGGGWKLRRMAKSDMGLSELQMFAR